MGLLMAVVTAAGRLATDLEVVAFSAAGVSPLRLFRPFLVAAVVVGLMIATLTIWINPWGSAAFFQCLRELRRHTAVPLIQERTFTRIGRSRRLHRGGGFVDVRAPRGCSSPTSGTPRRSESSRHRAGRLVDDAGSASGPSCGSTDGVAHESRPESPDWYRVTRFGIYETPLDVGGPDRRGREGRGTPEEAVHLGFDREHARAGFLAKGGEDGDVRRRIPQADWRFPWRPSSSPWSLSRWASGSHRGGRAVAAVGGIIVYLVHHVSQEGLIRVTALRPWGGGRWVPIMLFGLVGAVLLYFTVVPAPRIWHRARCTASRARSGSGCRRSAAAPSSRDRRTRGRRSHQSSLGRPVSRATVPRVFRLRAEAWRRRSSSSSISSRR